MSKTQEEACRHTHQCRGCKLWYCSNDEVLYCSYHDCREATLCYRCVGVNYPWETICKSCWRDLRKKKILVRNEIPCHHCRKYRRTYHDKEIEDGTTIRTCKGCYKYKGIRID